MDHKQENVVRCRVREQIHTQHWPMLQVKRLTRRFDEAVMERQLAPGGSINDLEGDWQVCMDLLLGFAMACGIRRAENRMTRQQGLECLVQRRRLHL